MIPIMKKMITHSGFQLLFVMTIVSGNSIKLAVGMKAPDWMFTDADKKEFTMNSWAGKVLQVNYVDPDESELNEPFNEAVNKAIDVDKRISRDHFKGFGIVDCKSTWKPNGLITCHCRQESKEIRYNNSI